MRGMSYQFRAPSCMGKHWSRRPAHIPAVFMRVTFHNAHWCLRRTYYMVPVYGEIGSRHVGGNTLKVFFLLSFKLFQVSCSIKQMRAGTTVSQSKTVDSEPRVPPPTSHSFAVWNTVDSIFIYCPVVSGNI